MPAWQLTGLQPNKLSVACNDILARIAAFRHVSKCAFVRAVRASLTAIANGVLQVKHDIVSHDEWIRARKR